MRSREAILAQQAQRLQRLLTHAYENVPYYRQLFEERGLRPDGLRSVEDLSLFPMSSKADLQQRARDFLARGARPDRMIARPTSGSSGQPVTILNTRWEEYRREARRRRVDGYYGVQRGDRRAAVGFARSRTRLNQLLWKAISALRGDTRVKFDCRQPPERILRQLATFEPTVIGGYAGVLNQVAQVALENGERTVRPRYLTAGGEMLLPSMRRNIRAAFAAPVYDVYSSNELKLTAWECRQSGLYHVCDDSLILEVVADGRAARDGEAGELIGTNLHSFAMPFIRFRVGDVVVKGPDRCPCGEPFSTLRAIQGRALEHFLLPGGRVVHPFALDVGLTPWIRNFSLVQEREDAVVARVVALAERTGEQVAELTRSVQAVLGPDVTFTLEFVSALEPAPSGKFQPYRGLGRPHVLAAPETGSPVPPR
ncbi:MAG: phenylacetate--CoA ligase family protein [Gemmatimonadetes bacterium]|nr:phenylacetate--CoA ligase family protein [Gemmatimonadota bacterium]